MSPVSPVEDAASYLVAPVAEGHGDYIWKLRLKAGIVVGATDAICQALTNFSPLDEWIVKPFGGNWKAFDQGAAAWKNAGKAAHAIEVNLRSVPGQVGDTWLGETASKFKEKHEKVADLITPLPEACDSLAEMCSALAELARTIGEFVVEVLKIVAERLLQISGLMSSVVGSPASVPLIGDLVAKIFHWTKQVADMINMFVKNLARIIEIAQKIGEIMEKLWKVIKPLMEFNHGMEGAGALAGGYSGGGGGGGGGGGF